MRLAGRRLPVVSLRDEANGRVGNGDFAMRQATEETGVRGGIGVRMQELMPARPGRDSRQDQQQAGERTCEDSLASGWPVPRKGMMPHETQYSPTLLGCKPRSRLARWVRA